MPSTSESSFPVLMSKRLTLRAPKAADAFAFRALLSIPEVTRFSNWPDAPTKAQGDRYTRWMQRLYPSGKGCAWIIEERARARPIGALRFNCFEMRWRYGEIGYELLPDVWGRGLMTEAVRLAVACGHETFKLNRIEAWTLPGNGASDRVLQKCGFVFEGVLLQKAYFKGGFHDFRMFARLANDPIRGG